MAGEKGAAPLLRARTRHSSRRTDRVGPAMRLQSRYAPERNAVQRRWIATSSISETSKGAVVAAPVSFRTICATAFFTR